jgi:hypothetical protein
VHILAPASLLGLFSSDKIRAAVAKTLVAFAHNTESASSAFVPKLTVSGSCRSRVPPTPQACHIQWRLKAALFEVRRSHLGAAWPSTAAPIAAPAAARSSTAARTASVDATMAVPGMGPLVAVRRRQLLGAVAHRLRLDLRPTGSNAGAGVLPVPAQRSLPPPSFAPRLLESQSHLRACLQNQSVSGFHVGYGASAGFAPPTQASSLLGEGGRADGQCRWVALATIWWNWDVSAVSSW